MQSTDILKHHKKTLTTRRLDTQDHQTQIDKYHSTVSAMMEQQGISHYKNMISPSNRFSGVCCQKRKISSRYIKKIRSFNIDDGIGTDINNKTYTGM